MEKFINQQVHTRKNEIGVVTKILESTPEYKITIKFNDIEKTLGFETVIKNKIIYFINENLQTEALKLVEKNIEKKDNEKKLKTNKIIEELNKSKKGIKINSETSTIKGVFSLLEEGKFYGTKAQEIYDSCCTAQGWPAKYRGHFGLRQLLYAKGIVNGYSVWFIPHSNLIGDSADKWTNYIHPPIIEEEYKENNYEESIGDIRITFYKNRNKEYVFAGVYQQVETKINDRNNIVLIYKKISDKYPLD